MGDNILGCFVSTEAASIKDSDIAKKNGALLGSYIWGENGINKKIILLKHEDYGKDMNLILIQFYVNPLLETQVYLNEIEPYRKKEKAIGIPIIITDDNFFSKTEEERYRFLKESILTKMDLLETVVKKRKLDTDVKKLKADIDRIL